MGKKHKFPGQRLREKREQEAKVAAAEKLAIDEKAQKSLDNIYRTNTTIFVFAQCLLEQLDRLNDEDHNYSVLKLGKNSHIVLRQVKYTCNKFIQELTKMIDKDSHIFTEEYLQNLNDTMAVFNTVVGEFGFRNIEKLHAMAHTLQEDDPKSLNQYYKERGNS